MTHKWVRARRLVKINFTDPRITSDSQSATLFLFFSVLVYESDNKQYVFVLQTKDLLVIGQCQATHYYI